MTSGINPSNNSYNNYYINKKTLNSSSSSKQDGSNDALYNNSYIEGRLPDYIPGIRSKEDWIKMVSDIMYRGFMNDEGFQKIKERLKELTENNGTIDYDSLLQLVNHALSNVKQYPYVLTEGYHDVVEDLNNLKQALTAEKEIVKAFTTTLNEKIDSLDTLIYALKEALSKPITPDDLSKFKALLKQLEERKSSITQIYKNEEAFRKYQAEEGSTNELIANAQKALAEQTVVPDTTMPTGDNADYPIDIDKDTFDTSIPRRKDGSIDIDAMIRKLHDLLYYMYHGDCSNFNIYTATAGFLTNVAGVWDKLSDEDKAKFNKIINTVPTTTSGKSLGDILAESVIYGKFYALQGNEEALFKFIDEISAKFEGKDNPFFKSFLDGLKKTKDSFPEWKNTHIDSTNKWTVSFTDFLKEQSLVNASIGRAQETADLFRLITRSKIQELEALAGGDSFVLFYLLLALLFEQNDNYQLKIAGVGKTIEKLDDLTNQATDIGLLFQQISARAKTDESNADFKQSFKMIDELMNKIKQFGKEFEADPRLQDSFSEIADEIKHFTAHGADGGLAYTGTKGDMSIAEYLENAKADPNLQVAFTKDFFKNCCPGKVDPTNIDPQTGQPSAPDIGPNYTQIMNDIQAFTKAPLNMNSTLTVKMEDIKSMAEQFGALMTKLMKDPNDLISRMLQRMQQ